MSSKKQGFLKDIQGNVLLPITSAQSVKDQYGADAFHSPDLAAIASDADGKGGRYGLMSPEEKAKLSGDGNTSLSGIETNLNKLNTNLKVDNVSLQLLSHPVNIECNDDVIAALDNATDPTKITLSVAGTLSGKNLSDCTADEPTKAENIATKNYVDSEVSKAQTVAIGALRFSGLITNNIDINSALQGGTVGNYYKVVAENPLEIASMYSFDGKKIIARLGDTLILHEVQGDKVFVHIPSGDESGWTVLQAKTATSSDYISCVGATTIDGSGPITVSKANNSNAITVSISAASESTPGYITVNDYKTFKQAATNTISYTSYLTSGTEYSLAIGKIAGTDVTIPTLETYKNSWNDVYIGQRTSAGAKGIKIVGNGVSISEDTDELTIAVNVHSSHSGQVGIVNNALKINTTSNTDAPTIGTDNRIATADYVDSMIVANMLQFVDETHTDYSNCWTLAFGSTNLN